MPPRPFDQWRRRAWKAFAVFVAVPLLFHAGSGWHASRALARREANIRQQELPLTLSDMRVRPLRARSFRVR